MPTVQNALAPTPQNSLGWQFPSAKERFLQSRDTSWADKFGGAVPFYPQQRYLDENLAPELGITKLQLEALAAANQNAVQSGLMSPKLAAKMLPTLLTEGASGIRGWGYADLPKYRALLEKAGLPPTVKEINALPRETEFDRQLIDAKLMHAMMAAKASIYGEEKAIERWNGQGTAKGGMADATNHARKVAELERLLQHPKNAPITQQWQDYLSRWAGGKPPTFDSLPDAPLSWAEQNLPTAFSEPLDRFLNALPSNPVKDAQRAIRNWTAR